MKIITLLFVLIASPVIAGAHGFGQTVELPSGNYMVAIDHPSPVLLAGEAEHFDFELIGGTTTDLWDRIWVRIAPEDGGITFAGVIAQPELMKTGMSYAFPEKGRYDMTVRFQKGAMAIAEATFPVEVKGSSPTFVVILPWAIALFAVLGCVFFCRRRGM